MNARALLTKRPSLFAVTHAGRRSGAPRRGAMTIAERWGLVFLAVCRVLASRIYDALNRAGRVREDPSNFIATQFEL